MITFLPLWILGAPVAVAGTTPRAHAPGRPDPRPSPERPLVIEREDDDANGNERVTTAQSANRPHANQERQR